MTPHFSWVCRQVLWPSDWITANNEMEGLGGITAPSKTRRGSKGEAMETKRSTRKSLRVGVLVILFLSGSLLPANLLLTGSVSTPSVNADSTPQTLPFTQNWSNTGLITADDNWSGVPGIVGFRGDDLGTTVTGTDPQTILLDGSATPIDVNANRSDPNTFATGGVTEFDGIANPVVALTGSGTADAPHIVINVNTTGMSGVKVAYLLRDIDGSTDNAVQPVALQFRVGSTGNYTNIPAGFVADATTGPSLATLVTTVSVTLPAATDNQPLVQLRIMTTNAVGNDEWVGIDDIIVFVPTEARLDSFDATRYADGRVLLKWRTGFEVDNLGFNLYRERNGKRTRVNSELIAGSALMVGEGTKLRSGYSYAWADDSSSGRDAQYWLEAVGLNGRTEMFRPVSTRPAKADDRLPPDSDRAVLLSSVGVTASRANSSTPLARTASAPQVAASQLVGTTGTASKLALKLSVDREGWYRVTQQELAAAGLTATADPRQLQLFAEGEEQAIIVRGEDDGRLDPADAIEFYGIGLDNPSTNTRKYWLVEGSRAGLRIRTAKAKGSRAAESGFAHTVERRDRTVYFSSLRNGDTENFFGAVIARAPVNQSLTVAHIDPQSTEDPVLEVALQGVTAVDHRVAVRFNESDLGELAFGSIENRSARFTVPRAAIREGQNVVTLANRPGEGDVSIVDSIRLTYQRTYTADDNALRFTAKGKRVLTIDGFTSPTIRVVDVTDPAAPSEVKTNIEQRESGYAARIKTPKGGERLLMAFTADQITHPVSVLADQPSDLRNKSRETDLVIVTRSELIQAIEPLVLLRQSQGLSVAVVDVEDIYDEFNFGEKSAKAVKDFFAFARAEWSKPPRFALIVGDASLDPKNHMGLGDFDVVPTKLVDTIVMETASDEWLVDFDDDGLGELAVGRLPARSADEAALMIGKTVAYESTAAPDGVLLVSDSNDGIDFESGTERLRELVSEGVTVEEIVRGRLTDGATKSQVLDSVRRGKRIVSYFGHGSVDLWRGILTSDDVTGMSGSNGLPLFLSITCLNGYFQDPALDSLAESLLKTQAGGAAAVWASSGMCGADEQLAMNLEMFRLMFNRGSNSGPLTLGEATLRAKRGVGDIDVRRTYTLFGDPTTRLR
jgi:Peptidase family C25